MLSLFKKPTIRSRIISGFIIFGLISSMVGILLFYSVSVSKGILIFIPSILIASFICGHHLAIFFQKDIDQLKTHFNNHQDSSSFQSQVPKLATKEFNDISSDFHQIIKKFQKQQKESDKNHTVSKKNTQTASENLTNFMYYFAHMIRTPLNAIRWSIESLKNEEVGTISPKQREVLDTMEHATVKLAGVATELQDTLTIVKGNQLSSKNETCDLLSVIDEAAGKWIVRARRKNLQLIWEHSDKVLNLMHSDCDQIKRVIGFLLGNAIRYSLEGQKVLINAQQISSHISISKKRTLALPVSIKKSGILISIKDHGIGIPKKELSQVFEPFFRATNAQRHWVDAKGIGLTLSQAIIQQHGGQVWLKSNLNRGTTAFIFLPHKK